MSEPTMVRVHLTVEVAADSDHNDTAAMRGLFAWVEELEDKAREQGEVKHLSIDGLPPRVVLVGRDETMMAHVRAAMREGGS